MKLTDFPATKKNDITRSYKTKSIIFRKSLFVNSETEKQTVSKAWASSSSRNKITLEITLLTSKKAFFVFSETSSTNFKERWTYFKVLGIRNNSKKQFVFLSN